MQRASKRAAKRKLLVDLLLLVAGISGLVSLRHLARVPVLQGALVYFLLWQAVWYGLRIFFMVGIWRRERALRPARKLWMALTVPIYALYPIWLGRGRLSSWIEQEEATAVANPKLTQLRELLVRDALNVAPPGETFTLASGKQSTWFVNGKEVTLRAEGLRLVAELMLERIVAAGAEAVGGMSIGADPMIGAIVALSAGTDQPLQGFIVRKAAKDHGLGDRIAGPQLTGVTRVALVEDVTTTGGSTLDACAAVQAVWPQLEIVRVLTIVDRLDGAAEAYAAAGYPFEALLTRDDLGVG